MYFQATVPLFYAFGLAITIPGIFAFSIPETHHSYSSDAYPVTVIDQFSTLTWLENIAVRQSGQILVTTLSTPSVYQIDQKSGISVNIANITGASGLSGIAELAQDMFYVAATNFDGVFPIPGSIAVWLVDVREMSISRSGQLIRPPKASLVAKIPDAKYLNGLCRLALGDNASLLMADSVAGQVLKLDVYTGVYSTAISDESMAIPAGVPSLGVNGIHTHQSELFFTNLEKESLFKIPISPSNGSATGPATLIVSGVPGDDFMISRDAKKAWVAANPQNTLVEVDVLLKTSKVVAGSTNSTEMRKISSLAFGRTRFDSNSLYVASVGDLEHPTTGGTIGGRVVRVDLGHQ